MTSEPAFDTMCDAIARALDVQDRALDEDTRLSALCTDELDLYRLHLACSAWSEAFVLPSDVDPAWATLRDVHHYLQLSTRG